MYNMLENTEWFAKRTCRNCQTELEIGMENIVYQRNWDAFMKKECFAYCQCGRKVHVSKRFIPKSVLRNIPKDNQTHSPTKARSSEEQQQHYLAKAKNLDVMHKCINCKTDNRITYDKLCVKRTGWSLDELLGESVVYAVCEACNTDMVLYSNSYNHMWGKYRAVRNEFIGTYDRTHICDNTGRLLISSLIWVPVLGIGLIGAALVLVPVLLIVPGRAICIYCKTKDTVAKN